MGYWKYMECAILRGHVLPRVCNSFAVYVKPSLYVTRPCIFVLWHCINAIEIGHTWHRSLLFFFTRKQFIIIFISIILFFFFKKSNKGNYKLNYCETLAFKFKTFEIKLSLPTIDNIPPQSTKVICLPYSCQLYQEESGEKTGHLGLSFASGRPTVTMTLESERNSMRVGKWRSNIPENIFCLGPTISWNDFSWSLYHRWDDLCDSLFRVSWR